MRKGNARNMKEKETGSVEKNRKRKYETKGKVLRLIKCRGKKWKEKRK